MPRLGHENILLGHGNHQLGHLQGHENGLLRLGPENGQLRYELEHLNNQLGNFDRRIPT